MTRLVAAVTTLLTLAALTSCARKTTIAQNGGSVRAEALASNKPSVAAVKTGLRAIVQEEERARRGAPKALVANKRSVAAVKTGPRAIEQEEKQARRGAPKLIERDYQQSVPSRANLEGPRALEFEKASTRSNAGKGLLLEGAAIGRRETARIAGFNDNDSDSGHSWASVGPVSAIYPVATSRTNAPYVASGRISALAIDPRCGVGEAEESRDDDDRRCRLYVGAAGGGIWRTDRPFSNNPKWQFTSEGFETNAIGTIAIDPRDPDTIYAGTGEPNASADSAAGLGIYRSRDGGESWHRLSSTLTFAGPSGPVTIADGFNDLSIAQILFDPNSSWTFYVATTLGVRGVSATEGAVLAANLAAPGLYKTTDGGATFTQIWDGGGASCAPFGGGCLTSWGVDKVQFDPDDSNIIYASAVDVGIWRSWSADSGGAFTQIFFSQNQANVGSDRTDFALTKLANGKTRIYAATGATGAFAGFPAPETSYSQVWRIDDAKRPAAQLIAEETQVVPGGLPPAAGGWKKLTSDVVGDPGYATFDYCTGQCWYDNSIYSPSGHPDTVFVIGSYTYNEAYSLSNARAVLRSTTAGDPDPNNNNVTFTDLTFDAQTPDPTSTDYLTKTISIHPDQHALVFAPSNPDIWFEGSDGGLIRSSGHYMSISATCANRVSAADQILACQRLLSAVPTHNISLNAGLVTLQFQNLSINPNNPLGELQGGTQDNGTFQFEGSPKVWFESIGGDGGLSGFDASNPTNRFHTFFSSTTDVNFAGGDPFHWLFVSDPFRHSHENVRFYMPIIADPRPDRGGSIFAGLQWIWRTTDNAGDPTFLANNCNEFGPFTNSGMCGDWKHLGNRRLTGGTVSWVSRTSGDTGTLWAGTASGRLYIFKNADATNPSTATESEVSDAIVANNTTPVRFISGIVIDPANPNHGWVSYGGYDAITSVAGETPLPGHVFDVSWDGVSAHATFTSLDGSGKGSLGDLPVNSMVRDDATGDLYVGTDFSVFRRDARTGHWHAAAKGLPMVEVSSLAIDQSKRVVYAATHGRSAWRLDLRKK